MKGKPGITECKGHSGMESLMRSDEDFVFEGKISGSRRVMHLP